MFGACGTSVKHNTCSSKGSQHYAQPDQEKVDQMKPTLPSTKGIQHYARPDPVWKAGDPFAARAGSTHNYNNKTNNKTK